MMLPGVNESVSLKTQCSCYACEPITCFAKRHTDKKCSCFDCSNQQTCMFVNTLNKTYGNFDLLDYKEQRENLSKELSEENRDECCSTTTVIKKQSKVSNRSSLLEKSATISSSFDNEVILNSRKLNAPTAHLSAQIMNVPFKEFEDSVNKSEQNNSKFSFESLFKKIRDVYKVCSCKVCDCIGISLNSEICNCKPCDCNDCKSFKKTIGGQLLKCSQASYCNKIANSREKCDCKPCECIQCTENKSEPCDCEPCHCFECRSHKLCKLQTLVVAPVGDDNRAVSICQCTPCSCVECVRNHCAHNETRREMSTGMNRHPRCQCDSCNNEACVPDSNHTCKCEIPVKLMRKPFRSHNTDYDIRRAETSKAERVDNRHPQDMIAMFAQISDGYTKNVCQSKLSGKKCSCDQCQCLNCSYGKSLADAVKSSNTFISNNVHKINKNVNCECSSCECKFCTEREVITNLVGKKSIDYEISDRYNSKTSTKTCKDRAIRKRNHKLSPKGKFTDCSKIVTKCTGNICDCINCKCETCVAKGNVSSIKSSINSAEFCFGNKLKNKGNLYEKNLDNPSINSFVCSHTSESISFDRSHHDPLINHISYHERNDFKKVVKKVGTITYAQNTDFSKQTANNIDIDDKAESIYSLSNCDDSGTISPEISSNRRTCKNSYDNMRNESYNYNVQNQHLKQYPKSTVAKCINDVMMLNMETDVSLEAITIASEVNNSQDVSSYFHDTECMKSVGIEEKTLSKCRSLKTLERKIESVRNNISLLRENVSLRKHQVSLNDPNGDTNKEKNNCLKKYQNVKETKRIGISQENEMKDTTNNVDHFENNIRNGLKNFSPWMIQKSPKNDTELDKDYDRVQKTLKRFSHQLIKLLDKYENANKEFESVSEKLQNHEFVKMTSLTSRENRSHKAKKTVHISNVPVTKIYQNGNHEFQVDDNINATVEKDEMLNKPQSNKSFAFSKENVCDIVENCNGAIIEFNYDLSNQLQSDDCVFGGENFCQDNSIHCKSNLNPIVEENEWPSDCIHSKIIEDWSEKRNQCLLDPKREIIESNIATYSIATVHSKTCSSLAQSGNGIGNVTNLKETDDVIIKNDVVYDHNVFVKVKSQAYNEHLQQEQIKNEPSWSKSDKKTEISDNLQILGDQKETETRQCIENLESMRLLYESNFNSHEILSNQNINFITENCNEVKIHSNKSVLDLQINSQLDPYVQSMHLLNKSNIDKYDILCHENIRDIIENCDGAIIEFSKSLSNESNNHREERTHLLPNLACSMCDNVSNQVMCDIIEESDGATLDLNNKEHKKIDFHLGSKIQDKQLLNQLKINESHTFSKYNNISEIIECCDGAVIEFNDNLNLQENKDPGDVRVERMMLIHESKISEYNLNPKESVREIIANHDGALIEFNYVVSNESCNRDTGSKNILHEDSVYSKPDSEFLLFKNNLNPVLEDKEIITDRDDIYCQLRQDMTTKKSNHTNTTKLSSLGSDSFKLEVNKETLKNAPLQLLNMEPATVQQNVSGDINFDIMKPILKIEQPHWKKEITWSALKNLCECDNEITNKGYFKQPFEGEADETYVLKQSKNAVVHEGPEVAKQVTNSIDLDNTVGKTTANKMIEREIDDNAFLDIHSEVKNLLDYPLLDKLENAMNVMSKNFQCFDLTSLQRKENNDRLDKESKCNRVDKKMLQVNSCDSLKVSSLTVNSVSEHTVMLKWEVPRVLDNIQGYELLVDGRAVQKNINTTRCIAMVSGLPQSDNVLLTVRTITFTPCNFGHNPSTTIVYKRKCKMD